MGTTADMSAEGKGEIRMVIKVREGGPLLSPIPSDTGQINAKLERHQIAAEGDAPGRGRGVVGMAFGRGETL